MLMTSLLALLVTYAAVTSLAAPAGVREYIGGAAGVTCIHGNVTYTAGQKYKPDACTTCLCSRHGDGRPRCVVEDCTAAAATVSRLNCRHPVTKKNECCAKCEEPGCLFKGKFYAAGAVSVRPWLRVK